MKLLYLLILLISGCSTLAHKEDYKLRLIGDMAFPPGTKFQNVPFGGLSGIAFDKKQKQLIAICDDRSHFAPARFYLLDMKLTQLDFDIKISKMVSLKSANTKVFKRGEVDFEGIALTPSNKLIISSEGDTQLIPRIPPSIMIFSRNGSYNGWVNIPDRYIPEHKGIQTKGPRKNAAFESLGITENGNYLFSATEDSMIQDGEAANLNSRGVIRIMRFEEDGDSFNFEAEFAYPLERIPAMKKFSKTRGSTGLVELLPLSKNHLFSMERSWTPENKKQTIRIYKIEIESQTTDVSKLSDLKDKNIIFVKKTLIANLDQFIPLLKNGKKKLDNIEGMALGPILKNGNPTLIIVSDDNFNKHQRTIFMAFEIL